MDGKHINWMEIARILAEAITRAFEERFPDAKERRRHEILHAAISIRNGNPALPFRVCIKIALDILTDLEELELHGTQGHDE